MIKRTNNPVFGSIMFSVMLFIALYPLSVLTASNHVHCDTLSLKDSFKNPSNKSLVELRKELDGLIYIDLPSKDSLLEFIICPNQKKVYTSIEIEKLNYLGAAYFENSELEKAQLIFEEILVQTPQQECIFNIAMAHNYLGIIAYVKGDWLNAYFHFQNLMKWEDKITNNLLTSAYLNLGAIYVSLEDYPRSEALYKKGLEIGKNSVLEYGWLLHRMGELKYEQNNYITAEAYFNTAKDHWIKNDNKRGLCYTESQLGQVYRKTKSNQETISYLQNLLKEEKYSDYDLCKIGLLLNLGEVYKAEKDYTKALTYLKESADLSLKEGTNQYRLTAYEKIIEIYLERGNIEQAKKVFHVYSELYESLYVKNRSRTTNSFQQIKAFIDKEQAFKLIQQKERYTGQQLKSHKLIILISLGLLFLSTLLGSVYYYYFRKNKKKNNLLKTLNTEISLQQEKLQKAKDKIGWQNQELEIQLVKKAMIINQYSESINKVKNILKTKDFYSQKDKVLDSLNQLNSKALQEELNLQITKANQNFFERLSNQFPKLTQNELRLCAFLKMNLSTKEIASLTFKNSDSIKVARSRLRKKLGLTHNKMAISVFLNQLKDVPPKQP